MLLCGDIHPNPGPVRYPCGVCNRPVAKNHRAMQCDECDTFVHIKCDGLNAKDYELFSKHKWLSWECWKCRLPNLSDSFFALDFETSNYFDTLSDGETTDIENEHHHPHPSNKMPSKTNSKTPKQSTKSQKIQNLRMMTVNVRGLNSTQKQLQFQELVEEHDHPDIICGTESHLDNATTNESLHPEYDFEREDREYGGGGVFIAIHKRWLSDPK